MAKYDDGAPLARLTKIVEGLSPTPVLTEIGTVVEVGDGIAIVDGLTNAFSDELLHFASGVRGVVLDLEAGRLGVVLFGATDRVTIGERVRRTRHVVGVPVGPALLGRVIDALGQPLDSSGRIAAEQYRPVESDAPEILSRAAITQPLATGLKVVDAAVPVGLGQRQLIIGDRQTGKTTIGVDTILNQASTGVICIYCAIGQRGDAVAKVLGALRAGGAMRHTIVMSAGDEDPPGLSYVAPFAAMTMAESFADQGHDVLVVMDDLTHHARSYRELSLLLRRPPGREAFPGDIFYLHARLLERAGNFTPAAGGGSITVLPVVETQAENLSAYIPTNLISITDGQIYLSPRLVRKNQFPAVDLGVSVSRVGGKAQSVAFREVAGNLRVRLSQFEELEDFARFGTRLDEATKARLARGASVRLALRQPAGDPISAVEQLTVLLAANDGIFDGMPEAEAVLGMSNVQAAARIKLRGLATRIADNKVLTDADRASCLDAARQAIGAMKVDHGADA